AQMRTISCTSSVACGNTTASGGSLAIQVVVLPCCSRTACEETSRLPNLAASAATTALIALGSRRLVCSDFSCTKAMACSLREQASRVAPATHGRRHRGVPFLTRSPRAAPERHQHPDLRAVALVLFAEQLHEVALFQEDADEDVGGGHGREQQVPDRHHGRCP